MVTTTGEQHSDDIRYAQLQEQQCQQWEAACIQCGACCGIVDGDPCQHLVAADGGCYRCAIYPDRFGLHRTRGGQPVRCVPLRDILHKSWPGDRQCAYKQYFLR